ncbi:MAG TPA: PQQ-binding-like beta-propeller repeat protein [Acidimicrobiales bacterium]|nr:PQQ-binding-like beta-propeller repeat protein [Acidimicrobiales bacterium]
MAGSLRQARWLLYLGMSLVLVTWVLELSPSAPTAAAPPIQLQWEVAAINNGGQPIAESSPNLAQLPGGPAVVVGDRAGNVYGYYLNTHYLSSPGPATAVPGWPVNAQAPVDSTPSVAPLPGNGLDDVFVGSGNAAVPLAPNAGYYGFGPTGVQLWYTPVVDPPTDAQPANGVQASLSVGTLQGKTGVVAGSLDQEEYALDAGSGSVLPGWPFFTSDSDFSTAAIGDLYGTGRNEIVEGGDQSPGFANGQGYTAGGHLRILNDRGGLICHDDTDQTVDSSPAIGGILAGGATGIVVGTGSFFPNAADTDTVKAFDTSCHQVWSTDLGGATGSSPALADVLGNGQLQVVEGTYNSSGAQVSVLDAATGAVVWQSDVSKLNETGTPNEIIGSVVAADIFNQGYDDILVPTIQGLFIIDGRTGAVVSELATSHHMSGLASVLGLQNAPLVTDDPDGNVGITIAGYSGFDASQAYIQHYEIAGTNGAEAVGAGSWPMFHHDPQLTGNAGGLPAPNSIPPCTIPAAAWDGYNLVASDGGIFSFGQPYCGSTGGLHLDAPIVGMAEAPSIGGYWLVASDGGVFAFGQAQYHGSMGGQHLVAPIVGMAATPDGGGYWLVASDGGVFAFGDATYWGSAAGIALHAPIVGISATADGGGYRLVSRDGGVFTYGDAQYFGSMGGQTLVGTIESLDLESNTAGYWEVGTDGGVFALGAPFFGSMGGRPLAAPIVDAMATADGGGYRFVSPDGGVFAFGDAAFAGSMGGQPLAAPVIGIAGF